MLQICEHWFVPLHFYDMLLCSVQFIHRFSWFLFLIIYLFILFKIIFKNIFFILFSNYFFVECYFFLLIIWLLIFMPLLISYIFSDLIKKLFNCIVNRLYTYLKKIDLILRQACTEGTCRCSREKGSDSRTLFPWFWKDCMNYQNCFFLIKILKFGDLY